MALVVIVTLEKEIREAQAAYAKAANGKALARELDRIDLAARIAKVTQLSSLLSENPAALAEQMKAEGFDPSKMRLPPEQWYSAGEGLKTFRAVAEHVAANPNNYKQPNPLLRDLKAAEALLAAAEAAGVKFHLTKASV